MGSHLGSEQKFFVDGVRLYTPEAKAVMVKP